MNPLKVVDYSPKTRSDVENIRSHLERYMQNKSIQCIEILEAGCGQRWELQMPNIDHRITGIDNSKEALEMRMKQQKDLDEAIVGDLRYASIEENSFDMIYSSYVLEHVDGAELVLNNFQKWLKPNGLMVLRIPDPYCAYGFWAKNLPFLLHVWYKRYISGDSNAGKPGHDPFPTYYDKVVSVKGMRDYCERNQLKILSEYSYDFSARGDLLVSFATKFIELVSLGRISSTRTDLFYILQSN